MGTVDTGNNDMTAERKEEIRDGWLDQLYRRIEDDLGALIQAESNKGSLMNPHHIRRLSGMKCRLRDAKKLSNKDY